MYFYLLFIDFFLIINSISVISLLMFKDKLEILCNNNMKIKKNLFVKTKFSCINDFFLLIYC